MDYASVRPKKGRLNLLLSLPEVLQGVVYSYDNTKVENFKHVLAEIKNSWPHILERRRVTLYIKQFIGSQNFWTNGYCSAGNVAKLFGRESNLNYINHLKSVRDFKVVFTERNQVLYFNVIPAKKNDFEMEEADGYFVEVDDFPQWFHPCQPSVLVTDNQKRNMYTFSE